MKSKLIKESFGEDIYYVEFESEDEALDQEYALRDGWGSYIDTEVKGNRVYASGRMAKKILTNWYGAENVVADDDFGFGMFGESSSHENQRRLVEAVAMLKDNDFKILNERERKFRPSPEMRDRYKEIPDELEVIKANAKRKIGRENLFRDFISYDLTLMKLNERLDGEIYDYLRRKLGDYADVSVEFLDDNFQFWYGRQVKTDAFKILKKIYHRKDVILVTDGNEYGEYCGISYNEPTMEEICEPYFANNDIDTFEKYTYGMLDYFIEVVKKDFSDLMKNIKIAERESNRTFSN